MQRLLLNGTERGAGVFSRLPSAFAAGKGPRSVRDGGLALAARGARPGCGVQTKRLQFIRRFAIIQSVSQHIKKNGRGESLPASKDDADIAQ